jgi:hypothetical protein
MPYTAQDKKEAVERELKYRRRVYPRWIADGRMTRDLADRQIAIFEDIMADYAKAEQSERLI